MVAEVKIGRRVMEARWDIVLKLSREPFEKEKICQGENVRLDETNNLLIERFTVTRRDLKL